MYHSIQLADYGALHNRDLANKIASGERLRLSSTDIVDFGVMLVWNHILAISFLLISVCHGENLEYCVRFEVAERFYHLLTQQFAPDKKVCIENIKSVYGRCPLDDIVCRCLAVQQSRDHCGIECQDKVRLYRN
jgi:hypothetical protein